MGFGLLLAGYIAAFLMSMTLYGWAVRILGCIVMILGCRKLHEYFRGFAYVEGAAALVALTGIAEGVFYVTERINSAVPDIVKTVEGWAWFAVVLLFHLLLGWELNLAAKAVGIEKPRTTALTSMVTAVIWALTYALGIMKLIEPGFYYVLLLVLIVLSAVAIYGCPPISARRFLVAGSVTRMADQSFRNWLLAACCATVSNVSTTSSGSGFGLNLRMERRSSRVSTVAL